MRMPGMPRELARAWAARVNALVITLTEGIPRDSVITVSWRPHAVQDPQSATMEIGLSQGCCLFYLKSSLLSLDLPLTFLCSIFSGFSLPFLLATAILDSFSLFYLPNIIIQHSSGSPSYSNQRRKRNKNNSDQKRKSKALTVCR